MKAGNFTTVMACAVALASATVIGLSGLSPAHAQGASQTDVKEHDTSPGGQYQPSLDVLAEEGAEAPGVKEGVPALTNAQFDQANKIYFQRCAGCHGVLRKGATGKALTPDLTRELGFEHLRDFIDYGSPAGMPNWGTSGDLTEAEIELMANYLLNEPAQPPEFGMPEIQLQIVRLHSKTISISTTSSR